MTRAPVLGAQDEIARMDCHAAADHRLIYGRNLTVIQEVAHVTTPAEQRKAHAADVGAVTGKAVDAVGSDVSRAR